uniref:Uncharacterized protein n=1 Tax=Percolomonas cosmopolitus TaxID=63605 RepID=A0A7S1PJQ4_9EUKA
MNTSQESSLSPPFLIWSLAEELLSLSRPIEAISLLQTLLSSISLLKQPMIEIKTRVRLGDLMTRYGADWDAAEAVLMKAKLMLDEMNFAEIQKHTDFLQIKLQLLQSLISLYEYKGAFQEAKKMLRYAINFVTEEDEKLKEQQKRHSNTTPAKEQPKTNSLLIKYNDAFRFNLVKVLFHLSEFHEASQTLQYFDDQSPRILQVLAQITRLHLMMSQISHERERIARFSNEVWDQMVGMLPENQIEPDEMSDEPTKHIVFWKQNFALLQQFCRFWLLNALFWTGACNWYPPAQHESSTGSISDLTDISDPSSFTAFTSFTEFKKYFALITSLTKQHKDLPQRNMVDEFLSAQDLRLFELLLEVLHLRTSQLKKMKELKQTLQSSQNTIDKLMDRLRQQFDLKGYQMDPKTESRMHLFLSLKILLEYNNCLYNLYRGHLSSCAEGIASLMDILENYPVLFSTYMHDVHILTGLYFVQVGDVDHAIEHFELVRKGCALTDRYTAAWATVFHMVALLNTSSSGDLKDMTPDIRHQLFSILDRTERDELYTIDTLQTVILIIKGCLYYSTGAVDDANQYLRRANELVRTSKNDETRCHIDLMLGKSFNALDNAHQTSRFVKHSMQLAARGRALYILQLGNAEHSEMTDINIGKWKESTFKQIHSYLQEERVKAVQHEAKLVNWFPHKSGAYFAAREHELVKSKE